MNFKHSTKLVEGVIKSAPSRFVMIVDLLDQKYVKCYCPSTVKIGSINFKDIPCLLSKQNGEKRKTEYTVEAISLDLPDSKKKEKTWIGINQNSANRYVEHFIKTGQLNEMFKGLIDHEKDVKNVQREQKLGNSKLDFKIGSNCYVEVKTPLESLGKIAESHPNYIAPKVNEKKGSQFFSRLIKHLTDLTKEIKGNEKKKAFLLRCRIYDCEPFILPPIYQRNREVVSVVKKAVQEGVEMWQLNLNFTPEEVSLIKLFPLELFSEEELEKLSQDEESDNKIETQKKSLKRKNSKEEKTPKKKKE